MKNRNMYLFLAISALALLVWLVARRGEQVVVRTEQVQSSVAPEPPGAGVTSETGIVEGPDSESAAAASEATSRAAAQTSTIDARVERFLDPRAKNVFLESYVRERLSEADLRDLYSAVKDERYARTWNSAVLAICVLEEDLTALEFVKSFAATPWDWQSSGRVGQDARLVVRGIVNTVVNLALLDPAVSGPFLADIFTRDGAERFLDNWNGYVYPEGATRELLVNDLMFSAASGLIHTRVSTYNKLVEDKARELHAIPKEDRTVAETDHLFNCCQLLGWRMVYEEMGWDEGIEYIDTLDSERAVDFSVVCLGKYIIYLNENADPNP